MIFLSNSEEETFLFGKKVSEKIKSGDIILLEGPLGAGKSILARGIASGLGINESMPSPTFTLVNQYSGKFTLFHFDLYRLSDPFELYEIGFEDYIYSKSVSLIEWPSKGGDLIPSEAIMIKINITKKGREIIIIWNR